MSDVLKSKLTKINHLNEQRLAAIHDLHVAIALQDLFPKVFDDGERVTTEFTGNWYIGKRLRVTTSTDRTFSVAINYVPDILITDDVRDSWRKRHNSGTPPWRGNNSPVTATQSKEG